MCAANAIEMGWPTKAISKPYDMNKRRDLLPPIIFSPKYMDKTPAIDNFVRSCYK